MPSAQSYPEPLDALAAGMDAVLAESACIGTRIPSETSARSCGREASRLTARAGRDRGAIGEGSRSSRAAG
jgi:hypothetical protein